MLPRGPEVPDSVKASFFEAEVQAWRNAHECEVYKFTVEEWEQVMLPAAQRAFDVVRANE